MLSLLLLAGCSPDLQETLGPVVPFPNVTGMIVREGIPVVDRKVKLEAPSVDSTLAEDRTDTAGLYEFTGVAPGTWVLKVSSSDAGDFQDVTCEVSLSEEGERLTAPEMDLSLRGVGFRQPADGAEVGRPTPASPVEFQWDKPTDPEREVQVRVYDAVGEAVWYGPKSTDDRVSWNGLGNRNNYTNRLVPPGSYSWKLRVEIDGSTLEHTTASRALVLKE
jgi:hypothetical protein